MRSLLRIIVPVFLFVLAGVAVIRQPVLPGFPYGNHARASAAALRQHVVFLTTDVAPRGARNTANLDRAADFIARSFRASGGRVDVQEYDARGRRYRNVFARFGPPHGPLLVIGAHYDAFCETGDLPAADDNASGTAALLELARLLGQTAPRQPILLAAWSTEEPPFFGSEQMGSAVHAESLARENVAGLICLEMIGYYAKTQTWPNWLFAMLYPSRGDFIAVGGGWDDRQLLRRVKRGIRGAGGIDVYSFVGPRVNLDASDQRNFWNRGWPAVLVTDTAFLRNPNYHTARDTAETLDYERMARVVDGLFNAAVH